VRIAGDLPSTLDYTVQIPLTIEEILGGGEKSGGLVEVALPSMLVGDAVAIQLHRGRISTEVKRKS